MKKGVSDLALQTAAQAWCTETTSGITDVVEQVLSGMDPVLCEAFAEILDRWIEKAEATRPAAAVDELIEAYRAVVYEEACLHCGKGETWTVKCPDGTYLGETWGDSDGQANAEEMAEALNCAYKQGYAAARAALTGEE